MLQGFIVETFGQEVWEEVVAKVDLPPEQFVSTCPYSDSYTYG